MLFENDGDLNGKIKKKKTMAVLPIKPKPTDTIQYHRNLCREFSSRWHTAGGGGDRVPRSKSTWKQKQTEPHKMVSPMHPRPEVYNRNI